ncbi:MAG: DcrB-related protein [Ignavibacteriaceae bacterium]|jgi:hypothetical protein|nr:DcrB-related protein [Ignavibacteriaceae bacterium]
MKIPDYYRQFQNQPPKKEEEAKLPENAETPSEKPQQKAEPQKQTQQPQQPAVKDKTIPYQGNGFSLEQLEDWKDETIYTLEGPVTDGIKHIFIVTVDTEPASEDLIEYSQIQIQSLERELKSCMLLKQGETKLTNGNNAYEAVFSWYPTDDLKIYQHQIYTMDNKTAYKLTATFTKKTRQTIGPAVVRMMLSFNSGKK